MGFYVLYAADAWFSCVESKSAGVAATSVASVARVCAFL